MKECQRMHDELKETVDIDDFQKALCITFENKGVISQFKTENIPAPQKTLAVNETKVKPDKKKEIAEETPELLKKVANEYKKNKMKATEDEAIKVEVVTLALNIATDPANDKKKVCQNAEIIKFLEGKKVKICWACILVNCFIKQTCSQKLKMKRQYLVIAQVNLSPSNS